MSAHLIYRDGYPVLAARAITARSWGLCAIQPAHEAELHDGLCETHLAQVYRDPLVIHRRRRLTREWLRHWWHQHCLLVSTLVLLVTWVLLVWELGALWATVQGVWGW
jgi:hypothetical protein